MLCFVAAYTYAFLYLHHGISSASDENRDSVFVALPDDWKKPQATYTAKMLLKDCPLPAER